MRGSDFDIGKPLELPFGSTGGAVRIWSFWILGGMSRRGIENSGVTSTGNGGVRHRDRSDDPYKTRK